ncbi:MAG: hypothetical protein LBG15_11835, partial [Dysgonamonadaceae bacterium]|nr:hypothetical protein [Dysgonamonadaceae bacterium]
PFQISSVRQFKKLATDIALLGSTEATYQKYFELTADLDFLADNTVTNTLIGAFYGTFDGKGHLIKDLNIDGTGKASISLFGELSYGEIKNLGREGGSITDTDATPIVMAGGIIYSMRNGGKLKNCYNSSSIVNTRLGSGLVGVWAMIGGSIENCYNTGNIAAKEFIGGLTASALGGGGNISVTNCYNFGDVTGGNRYSIGGLIGLFNDSNGNKQTLNANNVFNFGSVSSPNATASFGRIGSILGSMNETNSALVEINATNVYSRPDVASTNNGTTNKFNRPIGWGSTAGETLKNAILAANPTLGEDLKYTLEYGKSTDFVTELGGAFKYAPGRTPKLAWER